MKARSRTSHHIIFMHTQPGTEHLWIKVERTHTDTARFRDTEQSLPRMSCSTHNKPHSKSTIYKNCVETPTFHPHRHRPRSPLTPTPAATAHHAHSTLTSTQPSDRHSPTCASPPKRENRCHTQTISGIPRRTGQDALHSLRVSLRPSFIYGLLTSVLSPCSALYHLAPAPPSNTVSH